MSILKIGSNRSVAIIGNSASLFDKSLGSKIDSFDVVIRLNKGFAKDAAAQGLKTNVVGLSCRLSRWEFFRYYRSATPVWLTPKVEIIPNFLKNNSSLVYYPQESWNSLYSELADNRPSSGMMMVDFVVRSHSFSKLALFGFDFKATKTFYLKKDSKGPHAWELERKVIEGIASANQNIEIIS